MRETARCGIPRRQMDGLRCQVMCGLIIVAFRLPTIRR